MLILFDDAGFLCAERTAEEAAREVIERAVAVLDGGDLVIEWRDDDHVIMTGPAALSFTGEIEDHLVTQLPSHAAAA